MDTFFWGGVLSFDPTAWHWYMSLSGQRLALVESHLRFVADHPGGLGSFRVGRGWATLCKIADGKIWGFRIDYALGGDDLVVYRAKVLLKSPRGRR